MSAARYDNEGTFARSAGGAAFRGAILIAVAVAIGLLLLKTGLDDDNSSVSTGSGSPSATTPTTANGGSGGTSGSTTQTTAPIKQPGQVKVLVANGSGVQNAASVMSDALKADGYNVLQAANANQRVEATTVYYTQGFQREAQKLAQQIKASASTVQALPVPGPVADTAGANVVVVLGPDLAKPAT